MFAAFHCKGAGEVFDPQEQEKVAAEIETFLKVSFWRSVAVVEPLPDVL